MGDIITVSWFSAGVSSAVATKLVVNECDHIIYEHIDDQHPDTLRFVYDCEKWFGKPITILRSPYRTVEACCRAAQYVVGPSGAPCSKWMKRRVRVEWEMENRFFCTFRYVWGMDSRESARADRLVASMPEDKHLFPLIQRGISKAQAHGMLDAAGIRRPAMYDLGFPNNNCIGCVHGGKGYWNLIRVTFPDVFKARAALEREIGASCINGTFLDELDPDAGRVQGPLIQECGPWCAHDTWEGERQP